MEWLSELFIKMKNKNYIFLLILVIFLVNLISFASATDYIINENITSNLQGCEIHNTGSVTCTNRNGLFIDGNINHGFQTVLRFAFNLSSIPLTETITNVKLGLETGYYSGPPVASSNMSISVINANSTMIYTEYFSSRNVFNDSTIWNNLTQTQNNITFNASGISYMQANLGTGEVIYFGIVNNTADGALYFADNSSNTPTLYITTTTPSIENITFIPATPNSGLITKTKNVFINMSLTLISKLQKFVFGFGTSVTNYTFYEKDLQLMYNFDNLSSLGDNRSLVVDNSLYSRNGTFGTGNSFSMPNYTSGIYGLGLSFDGLNKSLNTNYQPTNGSKTWSAWIYPTGTFNTSFNRYIISNFNAFGGTSQNKGFALYHNGERFACRLTNSTGSFPGGVGWTIRLINTWTHAVCVYDSSSGNLSVYFDGVLKGVQKVAPGGDRNDNGNLAIGRLNINNNNPDYMFNGTIDEVRVWNRSLTANEVLQLYKSNFKKIGASSWEFITNQSSNNDGTYFYYGNMWNNTNVQFTTFTRNFTYDLTKLNISIISPLAKTYFVVNSTDFNISLTEIGDTCLFTLNKGVNNFTMSTLNNTFYNASSGLLSDGPHNVTFWCNDTAGNLATNSRTFATDNVPPYISLNFPVDNKILNYSLNIPFNFTAFDEAGISSCYLYTTFGSWGIKGQNTSVINNSGESSTIIKANITTDGTYNWNVYCNNTGNVFDWSQQGNEFFTIDTTAPYVKIKYPTATTYDFQNLELNYSAYDLASSLDSCWYTTDLGITNISINCGENQTGITGDIGANKWILYVNDSVGHINYSSVNFNIITSSLSITINHPTETEVYTTNTPNFSITGNNIISSCVYSLDSFTTNYSMSQLNDFDYYAISNYSLNDGSYIVNFFCYSNIIENNDATSRGFQVLKNVVTVTPGGTTINSPNYNPNSSSFSFGLTNDTNLYDIKASYPNEVYLNKKFKLTLNIFNSSNDLTDVNNIKLYPINETNITINNIQRNYKGIYEVELTITASNNPVIMIEAIQGDKIINKVIFIKLSDNGLVNNTLEDISNTLQNLLVKGYELFMNYWYIFVSGLGAILLIAILTKLGMLYSVLKK